jgi:hypothetical protein
MTTAAQAVPEKPATDLQTIVAGLPVPYILQPGELQENPGFLDNEELLARVRTAFGGLRDTFQKNLPYLLEAHNRFARPGQRLPVEGKPTWTQWVKANLQVNVRTVQRWLAPPKTKALPPKARRVKELRLFEELRDWPAAQRKANDLLFAVKRLKAKSPVGTDVLEEPVRQLAEILGFKLVKK